MCSIRNLEMIPAAPLKHHIFIGIQFLYDSADHYGIRIIIRIIDSHIHKLWIVCYQIGMSIGQNNKFMYISNVSIATIKFINHFIV